MSYTPYPAALSLPSTYPRVMAAATDLSPDEKKDLLALLTQLKAGGIKFNLVAVATGINYKSFINKAKSLEADVQESESKSRNRFTLADQEAIKSWWSAYRAQMFGA